MTHYSKISDISHGLSEIKYGSWHIESRNKVFVSVNTSLVYENNKPASERRIEFKKTIDNRLVHRALFNVVYLANLIISDVSMSLYKESGTIVEEWRRKNSSAIFRNKLSVITNIITDNEEETIFRLNEFNRDEFLRFLSNPDVNNLSFDSER